MDKKNTGIYRKFEVKRTDGRDAPGEKHDGCRYFVIDIDHDEFASAALHAYGMACREKYPELSKDLLQVSQGNKSSFDKI